MTGGMKRTFGEFGQRSIAILLVLGLIGFCESSPLWIASFLHPKDREQCIRTLSENSSLVVCDHSTIVFNPASISPWEPYFGEDETLQLLGCVEDTKAKACMVRVVKANVLSTNTYPHITIVAQPSGPYAALYSNILWTRMVADSPMKVVMDPVTKKPLHIYLPDGNTTWEGHLPAFYDNEFPPGHLYAATNATLWIFKEVVQFSCTVCLDTFWNGASCNQKLDN
eukprot:TRINITY_DN3767_c0_g1_i2.p1 TRINITY_DN3767_c0_g1~~TRINITY_DN3767_c0_g1_i2.p1  ORF type:complete len:248 (-),score=30.74 TRINITY_DN3767_c0_g1_i2:113-787(-)